jgi:hypothetical protein
MHLVVIGVARTIVEGGYRPFYRVVGPDLKVTTVSKDESLFLVINKSLCVGGILSAEAEPAKASMNTMVAANVESMMMRFISATSFLTLPTRVLATMVAQSEER